MRANQRHFGGKNVIPSSFYYEVLQQVNNTQHDSSFGIFDQQKGQLPVIRITEQPTLLAKSKINRPGYKSSEYFL